MNTLGNFQGINLESDISVITVDDNINHTYCSKIKWSKDNRGVVGTARLTMPYGEDIAQYWMKYSGVVVIHANLNSKEQFTTQSMMKNFPKTISLNLKNLQQKDIDIKEDTKEKQIHLQNDEYNYSFIGKVYKFKQIGKTFMVYLEDLGWKFLQKVPKEFRDSFIAGQPLDDAFQAICEFMGVEFAYSIEDLNEYNFSADGYSIEKDGTIIEDTPSILKEWAAEKEEDDDSQKTEDEQIADALKDGQSSFESTGLIEHTKKTQNIKKISENTDKALNSSVTNTNNEDENIDNNAETNTQDITDKMKQYQEEFDDKIKNLFIGNTFYSSNTSDPVLNYDAITIQPKSAISSEISGASGAIAGAGTSTGEDSEDNSSSEEGNMFSSASTALNHSLTIGSIRASLGLNKKSMKETLSGAYINSLTPAVAATMAKNIKYDSRTRKLLKKRARGLRI